MNKISKKGAWVLTKQPVVTEITLPPLTLIFAKPHKVVKESHISELGTGIDSLDVKVKTIFGNLVLHEGEYNIVNFPDYISGLGDSLEMITFDGTTSKQVKEKVFYLRSRGIPKIKAIEMLADSTDLSSFCYFRHSNEVQNMFFNTEKLINVWELEINQAKNYPEYLKNRHKELNYFLQ